MNDSSAARRSRVCVRSRLKAAVAVAVLAFSVAGCSKKGPLRADEGTESSAAALNTSPKTTDFAVYAQNSATLRDRAVVTGGDVGVRLVSSGTVLVPGYELALVADASVDTTHNVIANRLLLQDRAHVGDIQVNHEGPPSGGSYVHKYPFPSSMPALPALATVSPGTAALTVSGTSTASPGSYGAVSVGNAGVLRLKGGVYHFASLQIWNDAHIEALAPVQVRVAGRFSAADRVSIIAASGVTLTAGDLRIEVSGKNGSSGSLTDSPKAATFGNDSIVHAVMLVPNGTLQTGQRTHMVGAYVARDVYVDIDAKVTYQSGVGPSGCLNSCDDSNPCTTDTCSAGACVHAMVAAGTSCADNNACNGGETCDGQGHCKAGTPVTCPVPDQCHTLGTCNQTTGLCSNPAKPDGTACNDGNVQTQADVCTMGLCQGTIACASVSEILTGAAHTCALRTDRSLWCWGLNSDGQLGNGSSDNSLVPIRPGLSTWNWVSATAGGSHSCAIRSDSTLWCWGLNESGQLGSGTAQRVSTPVQASGQNWTTVAAGLEFTCGLQSGGTLWCWGGNSYANLASTAPVQVPGTTWASVATGYYHACGIQADHTLWCWGLNSDGQLGTNAGPKSAVPVQIGGAEWSFVTAGSSHTCAVKLDGSLWCWGGNLAGQLGTGTSSSSASPAKVGSANWTGVAAGGEHTCGIQTGGTLWCWGRNDSGEVGDGLSGNQLVPVRIPGQAWTTLAAGTHHTCGRRQDGSLWCWGQNTEGEVGDGTGNSCDTPEQVVGSLCSQVPICGNSQVEQGEECDDGNNTSDDGCTWNCLIEKCFGIVCKTLDTCHGVGGCDPATGACSNPVLDDGTQCDDHNGCTYDEKCSNGECKNGKPVICEGPPNCDPVTCDATIGKCATPTGCVGAEPIAQSLFQESWESGADGWTDSSGNPVTPATDSTSPAGAGVQKIDTSSTSYQSPWIPVQGGQQYCVAAYVRWVSGSWPFIGIQRHYEAGQTPPAVDWLIGQGSYPNSQFAPLTPVSATDPNWQYVSHTVSMPADVSQVRLVDELWDGDTKGGSELAYFDGLAIDNGACQTAVPETIYQQWWETDTAGWKDQSGKAATLVSDPTSPAGPNAQFIGPSTPAGPYSSPSVSLTAGSPYCVTSSVRWLGGQPPFVGVKFSNSATPTGLVGGDSGATVSTDTNWQTFSETILVPDSAGSAPSLQLVDGISTGASNPKPGDNQSYFDNISITAGPCQRRPSLEPAIVLASTIAGSSGTTPGRLDGTSR